MLVRLLLAFALGSLAAASAHGRPFTARDLAGLDRLSDARLSPDGGTIAYDLRVTDYDANRATHALWLIDAKTGDHARKLEAGGAESHSARWSPDGRQLYFLSKPEAGRIRFGARISPAPPDRSPALPLDVQAFQIAPDGRITSSWPWRFIPDAEAPDATKARLDAAKTTKASGVLYDRLMVRHWDTWADGRRNHLFAVEFG